MKITDHKHPYFHEFHETSSALTLGLIVITCGLYMIPWIYTKNKEFQLIDKESPDPNRGAIILLLLPFGWGHLTYIFRLLVWDHPLIQAIQFFGWILVGILILKYIWDFTHSFGKITESHSIIWFLAFIIPFITIPLMQSELNSHFHKHHIKRKYHQLYR